VVQQNDQHREVLRHLKAEEDASMRALEAQWSGELDKQERQRSRLLAQTYARQARQYAASDSMQEIMKKQGEADHARAVAQEQEIEKRESDKEAAKKSKRAALQRECLDVLAIQVKEKEIRAQAESTRGNALAVHAKTQLQREEEVDLAARANRKARSVAHAQDLMAQMKLQHERKTLEPFLLSKAEREMNATLLSRLG
jgi:hypothetical protein